MRAADRSRAGFTLIELMIVVAMIGILSAIAIPNFLDYQLKSKRSEGFANLASLATAQKSYAAVHGVYVGAAAEPGTTTGTAPGSMKRSFAGAMIPLFDTVGWTPEGDVFFDYDTNDANVGGGGCACTDMCFTAAAYGDLDGDMAISALLFVHPGRMGLTCTSAVGGFGTPVDPMTGIPQVDGVALSFAADDF